MVDFVRLTRALQANPGLRQRAALASLALRVASGDEAWSVQIGGEIVVNRGDAPQAAFGLSASASTWQAFAEAVPAVGYQSLVGMQRVGRLRVEGDMLVYARNLLLLEQVFCGTAPAGVDA